MPPATRPERGGDFYLATRGDIDLATCGDLFMATDTGSLVVTGPWAPHRFTRQSLLSAPRSHVGLAEDRWRSWRAPRTCRQP